MKFMAIAVLFGMALAGCSTLGLSSRYSATGPLEPALLNGTVSFDYQNPKGASERLGRGKKLYQAGATVDATLLTPVGRKLDFLAEAQRTRESRESIESGFAKVDKDLPPDRLCVVAGLKHQTIDLAKASSWKFKVSIDEGEWITLKPSGRDDIPSYSVVGGVTEWYSAGVYCSEVKNWLAAKKSIRVNVFPPVFVNPGEALLVWDLAPTVATK
jgi:hypothetical protein